MGICLLSASADTCLHTGELSEQGANNDPHSRRYFAQKRKESGKKVGFLAVCFWRIFEKVNKYFFFNIKLNPCTLILVPSSCSNQDFGSSYETWNFDLYTLLDLGPFMVRFTHLWLIGIRTLAGLYVMKCRLYKFLSIILINHPRRWQLSNCQY